MKVFWIFVPLIALSGCSSTITAWKNRPVAGHSLTPGRFFTLTGERRLAFQAERYDPQNPPEPWWDKRNKRWVRRVAWCAESLPEASQAVSASSKPNLTVNGAGTAGTEDSYSTTLLQTFTRTEIAEVYRQMAWQSCQAWAQGVYSDEQYRAQMDTLLKTGSGVILARASQPLNSDVAKAQADAAAAAKKKEEEDRTKAAKKAACAAKPTKECVEAL